MKRLKFHYNMEISFSSPINNHRFTLKCVPQTNDCQRIKNLEIDVFPKQFTSWDKDSYGNYCIYGFSENEHDHFHIDVKGEARTGLGSCEREEEPLGCYKYQTQCTAAGPAIKSFCDNIDFYGLTGYSKIMKLMTAVHGCIEYTQGVTTVGTTAEESMVLGKGVCQDYSHIMISVCRIMKIPARYVVGMMQGEGVSHAWVEVYLDGAWYGFDPTNNVPVAENHIKISCGRDYDDCALNRGVFYGNAAQKQEILVSVEEML